MINFTPHIPYFLYFPVYFGLTFVELDLALLLTCADWMRIGVTNNFDRFAFNRGCQSVISPIYSFLRTFRHYDAMHYSYSLILEVLCTFSCESHDKTHKKEAFEGITTFHFHQGETSVIKQ